MTEIEKAQSVIWATEKELAALQAEKVFMEQNKRLPALQQLGIARGKCIRLANAGLPIFDAEAELQNAQSAVDQITAEIDDLSQKIQLTGNRLQQARGYYHKINNSNAALV